MVGILGHHHVSQQACGRDTCVDHLRRHRCLDQRFALAADPFPTHMLLDREHTRRVIQLLADVFADALKLTAAGAGALGVFWFVTDHSARKLRGQGGTLGLLARFGRRSRRTQCLQFRLDGCDIGIEQAALVRT